MGSSKKRTINSCKKRLTHLLSGEKEVYAEGSPEQSIGLFYELEAKYKDFVPPTTRPRKRKGSEGTAMVARGVPVRGWMFVNGELDFIDSIAFLT